MTESTIVPGALQSTISGNPTFDLTRTSATSAALAGGGYVVTWREDPNGAPGADESDIWVQRFNADGTENGAAVRVNTTTAETQSTPQVAGLTGGNYVVVWESENQDGSGYGIYMQRYSAAGNPLGGEVLVNAGTLGDQTSPTITALSNGQYMIAYSSAVEITPGSWDVSVRLMRYNAAGVAQGGETIVQQESLAANIYDFPEASYHELDMVQLTGGNVAIAWTRSSLDDGAYSQMAIFTSVGAAVAGPIWPEQSVDDFGSLPQQHVVQLGNGNVLIIFGYSQNATGSLGVGYGEVYGRIYNSLGVAVGDEFAIATGTANRRFDLYASANNNGGAVVGWVEEADSGFGRALQLQQISDSGVLLGPPRAALALPTHQYMLADLVHLNSGELVFTAQTGNLGSNSDIVHRLIHDGDDARFTAAANIVVLGNGGESVAALEGSDAVTGGTGNDNITGGSDGDVLRGEAGEDVIHGDSGIDIIRGGTENDLIFGGSEGDFLYGDAGDDTVFGGTGNDTIRGNDNDDDLHGDGGSDTIYGGNGNDFIYGSRFFVADMDADDLETRDQGISNFLFGDGGNDEIWGGWGNDTLNGGEGDDRLFGFADYNNASGDDLMIGSNGNDVLNGGDGTDTADFTLIGRAITVTFVDAGLTGQWFEADLAADLVNPAETQILYDMEVIKGSALADTMTGHSGRDQFHGGGGIDTLSGDLGKDNLQGGGDDDTLNGDGGVDTLLGGLGSDTLNGGTENDVLRGEGSSDTLNGDDGDDDLFGGTGNDILNGGIGNDLLEGQGNNDTLDGGANDDIIRGSFGADTLIGGDGVDNLNGGGGTDFMDGGTGNDTMTGTLDGVRDTFFYRLDYDLDRINSFEQGTDEMHLDDALWGGGLTAAQVVSTYGTSNLTGTIITLDFGGGNILEVQNGAGLNLATLDTDIVLI